jgi:hypothetical protein
MPPKRKGFLPPTKSKKAKVAVCACCGKKASSILFLNHAKSVVLGNAKTRKLQPDDDAISTFVYKSGADTTKPLLMELIFSYESTHEQDVVLVVSPIPTNGVPVSMLLSSCPRDIADLIKVSVCVYLNKRYANDEFRELMNAGCDMGWLEDGKVFFNVDVNDDEGTIGCDAMRKSFIKDASNVPHVVKSFKGISLDDYVAFHNELDV